MSPWTVHTHTSRRATTATTSVILFFQSRTNAGSRQVCDSVVGYHACGGGRKARLMGTISRSVTKLKRANVETVRRGSSQERRREAAAEARMPDPTGVDTRVGFSSCVERSVRHRCQHPLVALHHLQIRQRHRAKQPAARLPMPRCVLLSMRQALPVRVRKPRVGLPLSIDILLRPRGRSLRTSASMPGSASSMYFLCVSNVWSLRAPENLLGSHLESCWVIWGFLVAL